MYQDIKHFPNLTPLRFVAAFLVVLFHIEETRKMFHLPNLTDYSLFGHGQLAVTFFFVLSGFLITYLLLREKKQTSQINVRRFYLRRALRIWPLYYWMVFLGLVLIPAGVKLGRVPYDSPFKPGDVALYFMAFLPFVVNLQYGNHFLTPLWSVGIEEMFYLGWGPVVKFLRRWLPAIMLTTLATKVALVFVADRMSAGPQGVELLRMLQFEAMAVGGLGAYFVFHRRQPIEANWLFSRPVQVVIVTFLCARLLAHESFVAVWPWYATVLDNALWTPLVMMVAFAWLIVNVAANRMNFLRVDSRVLNYLGDISYGIYMYHALAISLVFVPFLKHYRAMSPWVTTLLLHTLVPGVTLAMAAASKRFFEDRFLRLKDRFAPAASVPMTPGTKHSPPLPTSRAA
ncbi:MAG: acyltransferase [Pirellulales bacterium]|nr:acyltransferase [Pirellulales bacterium]